MAGLQALHGVRGVGQHALFHGGGHVAGVAKEVGHGVAHHHEVDVQEDDVVAEGQAVEYVLDLRAEVCAVVAVCVGGGVRCAVVVVVVVAAAAAAVVMVLGVVMACVWGGGPGGGGEVGGEGRRCACWRAGRYGGGTVGRELGPEQGPFEVGMGKCVSGKVMSASAAQAGDPCCTTPRQARLVPHALGRAVLAETVVCRGGAFGNAACMHACKHAPLDALR